MPNDYFLTKIYKSMNDKGEVKVDKPSNSPKPVQTIQQAYYRVILEQINEDADILMQNRDEKGNPYGDVEEFTVSDDIARQIKTSIRGGVDFVNKDGKSTNLKEIIKEVLVFNNWAKTSNLNFLIENIFNIFNREELVPSNIANYSETLKKSNNILKEKLINNPSSKINLKDLIPDWFHTFFKNNEGYDIVNDLWDLVPNTKPSSGRGELALTMISPSKKSPSGDLLIDGDLIEVKGSFGTMGGDNHIIDTSTELNQILKKDLTNISKTNRKQNLINRLNELPSKHESFKNNVIQQVENDVSFEEIKKIIDEGPLTDKNKERLYKTLISSLTIPKFNYRDSLLAFFSQYKILSDDQLADAVFASRNYKNISSPDSVKSKIKSLIVSNKNLFFKEDHERHFTKELASLIASLHLCCYQEIYKFKGIVFVNDVNKNMVFFPFKGNTVSENLENVYTFIIQFKPTINLAMTQIQKAAAFNFFDSN